MAAYAAALDHLGMISVTDTDGHIIYVNDQFVRACQYTREEVIGQDHRILKSGHHAPQFFKNMQKRIANGQPWRSHIRNRAKDGSHYWIDALISPLKHKNGRIAGYLSVGIEAMRDADIHQTKAGPRGSFRVVEKKMPEQVVSARSTLINDLRRALAAKNFEVHYQPIVNVASRRITGCEALIRWPHPKRGMIPASEFIPVAEESGLIGQIGDWVLKTACLQAKDWPSHVSVSVNISAAQLRGQDIVTTVMESLNGLPPGRLILEITESLLMHDVEAAALIIERLRKYGVRFALDDFGTGFSSLSYLQRFPFDKLKIDRAFMSSSANAERTSTLRRSINELGRNLGMITVAEGVETIEQLCALEIEGCIEAQGYLFSAAVPASQLTQLLASKRDIGPSRIEILRQAVA
jgi:PAS domain S-box-containing protein